MAARRQVHHTPLHPRPADGFSSGAAPALPGCPGGGRPVPETSWATDPLPQQRAGLVPALCRGRAARVFCVREGESSEGVRAKVEYGA